VRAASPKLEAESVAWICCDAVGIVSDQYSFADVLMGRQQ